MRLGLNLGAEEDLARAAAADDLGLWAVGVGGPAGTEAVRAARVAERTTHVRIVLELDLGAEHPLTLAEEIAVLDNLAGGRLVARVRAYPSLEVLDAFCEILAGRPVGAAVLAPPPAQTALPVWIDAATARGGPPQVARSPRAVAVRVGSPAPGECALSGDLSRDRITVDRWRDAGCTHLLVGWPGPVPTLARHLATRAATAEFPSLVADYADRLAPPGHQPPTP